MSIRSLISDTKRKRGLLLLAFPGILILFVNNYLPMFGMFIAFKSINYSQGIFKSPWVGFQNFKFFFQSQDAFMVTRNTIALNLIFITLNLVLSILFALFLFEISKNAVRIYQTVLFIPYLLSWVVVSYALYIFLNNDYGVLNSLLKTLFKLDPIYWYGEPAYWPLILTLSFLWKSLGYSTIIFYAGLMGMDTSYFEAASIDGATKIQQTLKLAVPLLSPLIVLILLTQIGRIFYSDFGMFYFLPKDSVMLYPTTDVIDTYVYRTLRVVGEPGMAAAVGLYQSAVGFILVVLSNASIRKISEENSLF